jgi:Tol biopolymer transport system component
MNRDGTGIEAISQGRAFVYSPQWCLTGDRIVYGSTAADYEIYVVDQEGQGLPFKYGDWQTYSPSCSPDGEGITFLTRNPGTGLNDLYARDLRRNTSTFIAQGADQQVAWSPDGKYVVYSPRLQDRWGGLCIAGLESGAKGSPPDLRPCPIPGTEGLVGPRWSPDGQWLIASYPTGPDDPTGIYVLNAAQLLASTEASPPLLLSPVEQVKTDSTPIWLGDSRHIAFIEWGHTGEPWWIHVLDVALQCPALRLQVQEGAWGLSWSGAS